MGNRIRTDVSELEKVREIAKKHGGSIVIYPDKSYKCIGIFDVTVDYEMGKVNLIDIGSPSRLKSNRI